MYELGLRFLTNAIQGCTTSQVVNVRATDYIKTRILQLEQISLQKGRFEVGLFEIILTVCYQIQER